MLKTIIKRSGEREPFEPSKLNKWSEWSTEDVKGRVDWASIVMATVKTCGEEIQSQALNEQLIKQCVRKKSWPYSLMAGRLYNAVIRKEMFDGVMPTVQALQAKMVATGFMIDLSYSNEEYAAIEKFVNHNKDMHMAYFQIKQIKKKYSLAIRNKGKEQEFETPQFVFIRMAMALAKDEPIEKRVSEVQAFYEQFSSCIVNAPSPNYMNLGTGHNGFQSCCLYYAGDNARSLAIGDHIAYTMTYMSAGIGGYIDTRSLGDPVRGGVIEHKGKFSYYESQAKAVKANTQGGRGGACTTFYSIFDPDIEFLLMLQNPRTPVDSQNRDIHFAAMFNKLFAKKVLKNEQIFLFNSFTAPDLHALFFTDDEKAFEELYNKYEQNPVFVKKFVSARDVALRLWHQRHEVATMYTLQIDEVNRHTPFKEPIHSSNLCVAPSTEILTDKGWSKISELVTQKVNVWNGEKFSETTVYQTSQFSKLIKVVTSNGHVLDCTPEHKFYILGTSDSNAPIEISAADLKEGMELIKFDLPIIEGTDTLIDCKLFNFTTPSALYTVKTRLDWLAELADTTGHVEVNENSQQLVINSPSFSFLNQTLLMVQTLGVSGKIISDKIKIEGQHSFVISNNDFKKLIDLGLNLQKLSVSEFTVQDNNSFPIIIAGIVENDKYDKTYCFTEPERHMGMFNGILTGQCMEIALHTEEYEHITDLYKESDDVKGEVATCSLGGIVVSNELSDDQYFNAAYYSLKMADKCIHMSHYELPHVGYTTKKRLSIGIGIIGLAYHLAKLGLKYNTLEGRNEIHKVAERHMYFLIKASLQLGKELGNAPWIHKTKWPDGWLPIDTYKKSIDEVVTVGLQYNWETLRAEIIANGGIRHTTVAAHMPTESSSKASGAPNGPYPIRDLSLKKSDADNVLEWCAPDNDLLEDQYQLAWDISTVDMMKVYGIIQKFTDQGISADFYTDRVAKPIITSDDIIEEMRAMVKYGVKSQYYQNTYSVESVKVENVPVPIERVESIDTETHQANFDKQLEQAISGNSNNERGCSSGVCTL